MTIANIRSWERSSHTFSPSSAQKNWTLTHRKRHGTSPVGCVFGLANANSNRMAWTSRFCWGFSMGSFGFKVWTCLEQTNNMSKLAVVRTTCMLFFTSTFFRQVILFMYHWSQQKGVMKKSSCQIVNISGHKISMDKVTNNYFLMMKPIHTRR